MPRYPISVILWLAKLSIKDKIQDVLHIKNNVDAYITIEVKDKNGNIIKRHKQRSHSFVANFLTQLEHVLFNGVYALPGNGWNPPLGYNMGLEIGTGTGTPKPSDTNLFNLISNGTGSGQMSYPSSPSIGQVVINGNTSLFVISSTITNGSGSSVTITEVGLYAQTTNSLITGLLTHDILSSPVTVPSGASITVTYTISVTT
jgi:hypothetical protein